MSRPAGGVSTELDDVKKKQNDLRERMLKRRKQSSTEEEDKGSAPSNAAKPEAFPDSSPVVELSEQDSKDTILAAEPVNPVELHRNQIKRCIVQALLDEEVEIPIESLALMRELSKLFPTLEADVASAGWANLDALLRSMSADGDIVADDVALVNGQRLLVLDVSRPRLVALSRSLGRVSSEKQPPPAPVSAPASSKRREPSKDAAQKPAGQESVEDILAAPSSRERLKKEVGEEITRILEAPTVKDQSLLRQFKTKGGPKMREYCEHGTKEECRKAHRIYLACKKLHFRRIIMPHTDQNLGDCSYLDTCRHMKTCKFVHYEVDASDDLHGPPTPVHGLGSAPVSQQDATKVAQWMNCDIRTLDMKILGKFSVIMADPPWDIHMSLPYGTMSDDEMRKMDIGCLQDDGHIFLWVTGRAMELGRECLQIWGYDRVEELIWVKTNQLQRIIRTGRTGHWLNHSKEHCLVGVKGNPTVNRFVDCDVIVSEVRETSRKPDEIYDVLERLSPATRKLEIFGRKHNLHPGWITLGNQLDGSYVIDREILAKLEAEKRRTDDS
eukprot:TRINITY_DN26841_c0_g1_i2.p1 TRINITY_DN26841_c0_g1~~TRINITY_DN26841_c0_g1_i2.p1  ORF type:complete len:556 (+),score=38.27 TRINITY_DN26841_c0_g1_i2:66-1733(+)